MLRSKRKVMKERIERERKKERDREVIMKVMVGVVLMFALIVWGGGLIAMGFPIVIGASILPKEGSTLREKWAKMSKKQKGLFALIILLMMPFIIVGLLWTVLIGSMIVIDIMVFLPIFLIVSWFIFRNPKNQKGIATKFLGSYYSLAIGVFLLLIIIALASYNYYEYQKQLSFKNIDWSKNVAPLVKPDSQGYVHMNGYLVLPNGTVKRTFKVNESKSHDVVFEVRDVFTPEWWESYGNTGVNMNASKEDVIGWDNESNYENHTDYHNKTVWTWKEYVNVTVDKFGIAVSGAYVWLIGLAKGGNKLGVPKGSLVNFIAGQTDSSGIVVFHNVSEGLYMLKVEAYGYRFFSHEFVVCNETTNGHAWLIPMIPNYQHMTVIYNMFIYKKDITPAWNILFNSFKSSISNASISVIPTSVPDKDIMSGNIHFGEKNVTSDIGWWFFGNLKRTQSMYGWLGVGAYWSPLTPLTESIWLNQEMIYTQSIYMNPTYSQNMYAHTYHLVGLIIAIVVVAVAVAGYVIASYATQKHYYVKIDKIDFTIEAHPNEKNVGIAHPTVYIWSYDSLAKGFSRDSFTTTFTGDEIAKIWGTQISDNKVLGVNLFWWANYVSGYATVTFTISVKVWWHLVDDSGNKVENTKEYTYSSLATVNIKIAQQWTTMYH